MAEQTTEEEGSMKRLVLLRIKAAWHVLRGKPTIYGCTFDVAKTLPLHTDTREAFIVANTWRKEEAA